MKLVDASMQRIRQAVQASARPVVMCSFGKDSLALLHLVKFGCGLDLPVIYHRDPWFPIKHAFADSVIRQWDLTVYDYLPFAVSLRHGRGIVELMQHFQIGTHPDGTPVQTMVPLNIIQPEEGERYLCGRDFFTRPVGSIQYPFDAVLIGHKSSDQDQIAGAVPLKCDVRQAGGVGPDAWFPLRNWTDADVWAYLEEHQIPIPAERYAKDQATGQWGEIASKTANPDYIPACIRCVDRRLAGTVHCPKLGCEVSNISSQVPYIETTPDYIG